MTLKKRKSPDKGASLVEFALLAPFLLLLLLGMIEFGYIFGQYNEVRHAAREGARYAAVSQPDLDGGGIGNSDVVEAVCDSINLPGSTVTVTMNKVDTDGTPIDAGSSPDRGDYGEVVVVSTINSLSGAPIISSLLPSQLTNNAIFRLEQDAAWTAGTSGNC
ncbi:MAG: TadE/TadG family type IV pilus assembly protein [Actinomycetota bacterium]|nr:TadE/TadG family type IV pilus assembly protein [Actinomycetota bacterium]